MKKIIIGALAIIILQFVLLFSVIIYKGEKSYYTYYAFLSKFPNNFTEEYLDSAIKQTDLSEAIKLLKRQKKLIYSNSNEIMVGDLLINTYKVSNIVNTKTEKKDFLLWLDELNKFIKKGYGDYYLDFIYFKTKYDLAKDDNSEKIFRDIQKLNFSNPHVYKKPLIKYFQQDNKTKINRLCKQYVDSDTIFLPNTSKFDFNNQKFKEYGDQIKIFLNDDSKNFLLKKIYLNQNDQIIIDKNFFKDIDEISQINIDAFFQSGIIFKIKRINIIRENDQRELYENFLLNANSGLFYEKNTYFGFDNNNRDKIDIYFKDNVRDFNYIKLDINVSKLNPTSINCND